MEETIFLNGGRLTLIKSVLHGMPTYLLSIFSMPAALEKKMNSIKNRFLWDENEDVKRIHLVKRQVVLRDKKGVEWV